MLTGVDTVGVASKPILKYFFVSVEKHCQTFFHSLSITEEVLPTIFSLFTKFEVFFYSHMVSSDTQGQVIFARGKLHRCFHVSSVLHMRANEDIELKSPCFRYFPEDILEAKTTVIK